MSAEVGFEGPLSSLQTCNTHFYQQLPATVKSQTHKIFAHCKYFATTTANQNETRMWANTQRDGRPIEHRWRPLFNAAKFGSRSLLDAVQ